MPEIPSGSVQDPTQAVSQSARLVSAVSPLAKKVAPPSARAREYIQAKKLNLQQEHLAAIAELTAGEGQQRPVKHVSAEV